MGFTIVQDQPASADVTLGSGLSGGKTLHPFTSLSFDQDWTSSHWTSSIESTGRVQFDDGLGDATWSTEWYAETEPTARMLLELDAAYGFDRESTQSLKQEHSFGADIGIQQKFDVVTLKADAGFETFLHLDTTQPGFAPIKRAAEDFTESEFALRATFMPGKKWRPFGEVAHVRRDYFKSPEREFSGPELVLGVTFAMPTLSGDVGAIYAMRETVQGKQTQTLGPYVDLKWTPDTGTVFSLAMSAGIDQDTAGTADLYPYTSARLELSQSPTDAVSFSAILDVTREDRTTGRETEVKPTIKLAWSGNSGLGLHVAAGLTHTRIQDEQPTTDPSFELGLTWTLGKKK